MSTGLFCQKCGELNDSQAQFCRKCGTPQGTGAQFASAAPMGPAVTAAAVAPAYEGGGAQIPWPVPQSQAGGTAAVVAQPLNAGMMFRGYAGFWIRFVAVLIDAAVLSIVIVPLWILIFVAMGAASSMQSASRNPDAAVAVVMTVMPLLMLAIIGGNWLYEALLTSSSKQGTLGKMALGLKVVDKNGSRLSFLHATGRHFAKMINGFTFYIGFIMAGFTERKQGLHDLIAGTYVVKS
jgi:uncharacterized RDD family membrane protein YckC